eukprot:7255884-Prymnesium_polylepis.1
MLAPRCWCPISEHIRGDISAGRPRMQNCQAIEFTAWGIQSRVKACRTSPDASLWSYRCTSLQGRSG